MVTDLIIAQAAQREVETLDVMGTLSLPRDSIVRRARRSLGKTHLRLLEMMVLPKVLLIYLFV